MQSSVAARSSPTSFAAAELLEGIDGGVNSHLDERMQKIEGRVDVVSLDVGVCPSVIWAHTPLARSQD